MTKKQFFWLVIALLLFAGTGISSRLCDKKCIAAGDFAEITRRAKVFMDITRAHE